MGQGDILSFLEARYRENSDAYYTQSEISKALGVGNCSTPLKSLRKSWDVEFRFRSFGTYEYRFRPEKFRI